MRMDSKMRSKTNGEFVVKTIRNFSLAVKNKAIGGYVKFSLEFKQAVSNVSVATFGWLAVLLLHAMTIPTLISLMTGVTDKTPPIDMVMISWTALVLLFIKAVIQRDVLNILTIFLGFVAQAFLIALIFFK